MISICSLIYKSTVFADAVWDSLHENTPHLHDGRARFFFVANDPTDNLIRHLRNKRYPFVLQKNKIIPMERLRKIGYHDPDYISRVYQGFNRAIKESEEQLVLVNSDMLFSPGWLEGLIENWSENKFLVSTLVERFHPKFGVFPGAHHGEYGDHPTRFLKKEFLNFANSISRPGVQPGIGYAPCMFSRSKALEVGMYPEGNFLTTDGPVYGDQSFVAKLFEIGVTHLTANNSIVYHFKEGEKEE